MKDEISNIVKMLIDATSQNLLIWEIASEKDSEVCLKSIGEDKTIFTVTLKYSFIKDDYQFEKDPSLWLYNDDLPNGIMLLYGGTYTDVVILRDMLKEKYCPDFKPPTEALQKKLISICGNISKELHRDNKLKEIL
jgi:hypothetical protein